MQVNCQKLCQDILICALYSALAHTGMEQQQNKNFTFHGTSKCFLRCQIDTRKGSLVGEKPLKYIFLHSILRMFSSELHNHLIGNYAVDMYA